MDKILENDNASNVPVPTHDEITKIREEDRDDDGCPPTENKKEEIGGGLDGSLLFAKPECRTIVLLFFYCFYCLIIFLASLEHTHTSEYQ